MVPAPPLNTNQGSTAAVLRMVSRRMMEWTMPALMYGMTVPFFLTIVHIYFYLRFRERFLGLWTISWIVLLIRAMLMVWAIRVRRPELILAFDHAGALGSGLPLIVGTYSFLRKKTPPFLIPGFTASFAWYLAAQLFGFSFLLQSTPIWLFLGIVHIQAGLVMMRHKRRRPVAYSIAGWAFVLWGIQKLGYPLLRTSSRFGPWGYFTGGVLFMILTAGLLMIYIEGIKGQLNAKIDQIKVLTGLLPICAVCKKIRDDQGYWNQIEAYIQEHSDAKFSHGICPDCAGP
jgi:hypothetical protein